MKIIPTPTDSSPSLDLTEVSERLEALEKMTKSILQRIQTIEERLSEANHPSSLPSPLKGEGVRLDTDALKKGLLTKMWKHLNDERPPKAA
jgi:hypothetical protein